MIARESPTPPPQGEQFNVVVIGAGIGGLLASIGLRLDGHNVTILEQSSEFGEVGAGMRIPPNSFKILRRWGVDLTYMKKTYSNGNRFLRYDNGEILADISHGVPELDFGGSYLMVHRADYHEVLLARALELGVIVRGSCTVESYDFDVPEAILQSSERVSADFLVIADGVQSKARELFQGHKLPATDTGDISYRILIPGQDMLSDPDLRELMSQPWVSSWCGPGAHLIGYPIRGGEIYNVVCCASEATMNDQKFVDGETKLLINSNEELTRRFSEWEPRVRKIVGMAGQDFLKWRLFDLEMVDNWVHPSGKAVLLGDAVHPMLPYMASGAAMACEDAAALRQVIRDATKDTLAGAFQQYQKVRQPRASVLQKSGRRLQHAYHLPDGKAQLERDDLIKQDDERNPIFWGYNNRRQWLFGHDAEDIPRTV